MHFGELHIHELFKFLLKKLEKEIGGTKQFYAQIFNEEEVKLLQSVQRRIQLKLSKATKESTDET